MPVFPISEPQPTVYAQVSFASFLDVEGSQEQVDASICKTGYYAQEKDRNVLILHSSGTTGLPKPIYQSHKWLLSFTTCHEFSGDEEARSLCLSTLPLYHVSPFPPSNGHSLTKNLQGYGLVTPALSLSIGKTLCIPPPSVIPTGPFITDLLRTTNAQSLVSVPSILEEMSNMPEGKGLHALASLQFVAFGGGLLKSSVGQKFTSHGIKVLNHYGSTESGPIAPFFVPTPDYDWRYFRLRKDVDMRIESGPTLDDNTQSYTLITHPCGWTKPFILQDQLVSNPQHPTSDFTAIGRNDDLIVLANGEKVTPRILETSLFECQLVKSAICFGDGCFEVGVLVQPSSPGAVEDTEEFKSLIWPIVVQAGERMDAHARISSREAIVVVPSDTILPRSDKGSLMRKEVYSMFAAEISAVYQALDNFSLGSSIVRLGMNDLNEGLKSIIQNRLGWRLEPREWTENDDLFELGMDSLQAVQLRRFIISSLSDLRDTSTDTASLPLDIIYQNPTVAQLATALRVSAELPPQNSTIDYFVEQFSAVPGASQSTPKAGAVVLMTGGTGSLGSHVLARLASLPNVSRIISLNRPNQTSDGSTLQLQALESRGISIDPDNWAKVEVLQAHAALPSLGLNEAQYARMQHEITHVLHIAWPMDFKRRLPSFKAQFQALQNLVALARAVHIVRPLTRPRILFVSSIAVAGQYPPTMGETIVPEVPMKEERCTNDIGYAKAKLVCEKMLAKAAQDYATCLEVAYVRVGQISGSAKTGSWNSDEHIAALFKSSQAIGCLPKLRGVSSFQERVEFVNVC